MYVSSYRSEVFFTDRLKESRNQESYNLVYCMELSRFFLGKIAFRGILISCFEQKYGFVAS